MILRHIPFALVFKLLDALSVLSVVVHVVSYKNSQGGSVVVQLVYVYSRKLQSGNQSKLQAVSDLNIAYVPTTSRQLLTPNCVVVVHSSLP